MNKSAIICTLAAAWCATVHADEKVLAPGRGPASEAELLEKISEINPDKKTAAPAAVSAPAKFSLGPSSSPLEVDLTTKGAAELPGEKDKTGPAAKKEKGPTQIDAEAATFDNKSHVAVFVDNVVVKDPEFNVTCDKLTAFLKHDDDKPAPAAKPVPAKADAATEAKPGDNKKGGLERAIAEGHVVIVQDKTEADGSITKGIGHGRRATYTTKPGEVFQTPRGPYTTRAGDVVLEGMPDVQQGMNKSVATDDSTVMILNRDGQMRALGPHRSTIEDKAELNGKDNAKPATKKLP